MNDNIKNIIQQHRHVFDAGIPDAHHWKVVEKMLNRLEHADGLERVLMFERVLLDTETPPDACWNAVEQELDAASGKFEQWMLANRDALDTELPDARIWQGIEQAMAPAATAQNAKIVPMSRLRLLMRVAASIALLLTGMGIGLWYADNGPKAAGSGMAMSDVSTQYAELEQYYQRDIAAKQVRLSSFQGSQPAEVHEDLDQMDHVMEELRKELADVPPGNREQVVRAMIENYKAKSAILQRVLERLESSKTETSNSGKKHEIKNI